MLLLHCAIAPGSTRERAVHSRVLGPLMALLPTAAWCGVATAGASRLMTFSKTLTRPLPILDLTSCRLLQGHLQHYRTATRI